MKRISMVLRSLFLSVLISCTGCGGSRESQLLNELTSTNVDARRAAVRALGEQKSSTPEVVAALEKAVMDSDQEVRRLSCIALGEFQSKNSAPLKVALDDSATAVRMAAAYALLKVEPGCEPATKVLCKQMEQGDGGVIVAVTRGTAPADWAIPTLTKLLRDRRPGIRRLSAEGLGRLGASAKSALPELQSAAEDSDDRVRAAAANAIARLNGGPENP